MDLITITEAAATLGVHPRTLRRWLAAGRLRYVRLPSGRRRLVRRDLDELLEPVRMSGLGGLVDGEDVLHAPGGGAT